MQEMTSRPPTLVPGGSPVPEYQPPPPSRPPPSTFQPPVSSAAAGPGSQPPPAYGDFAPAPMPAPRGYPVTGAGAPSSRPPSYSAGTSGPSEGKLADESSKESEAPTTSRHRRNHSMPTPPTEFDQLSKLDEEVLQVMAIPSNTTDRLRVLDAHPRVKSYTLDMYERLAKLRKDNIAKARANLEHESTIEELQVEILSLQSEVDAARRRLQPKLQAPTGVAGGLGPTVARRLEASADVPYERSEDLARDFQDGSLGEGQQALKAFLSEFMRLREDYHKRMAMSQAIAAFGLRS